MSNGESSRGWPNILNAVSDWIKLLALIVLIAEAILVVAMTQAPEGDPMRRWYPIVIVGLLGVIVIGTFFDRYLQRPSLTPIVNQQPNIESIISSIGSSSDKEIAHALKNMGNGITKALSIDNATFRKAILRRINQFSADINNWENGQLYVGAMDSKEYLLELYRDAQDNVFSTSVKDFFNQWADHFGERILEANNESSAKVTRVFIFNSRSEVTTEDYEQMLKQCDHDINVRVYFDEEDRFFNFPPNVSRDFTIIDNGKAIGVTESYGRENNSARWYFNNPMVANQFQDIKESLINGSKQFKNFQSWWEEQGSK